MSAFSVVELLCAVDISPEASLLVVEQSDLDWDSLCLITAEDLVEFGIDLEQSASLSARICGLRSQVRSMKQPDGEQGAAEEKPLEEPFRVSAAEFTAWALSHDYVIDAAAGERLFASLNPDAAEKTLHSGQVMLWLADSATLAALKAGVLEQRQKQMAECSANASIHQQGTTKPTSTLSKSKKKRNKKNKKNKKSKAKKQNRQVNSASSSLNATQVSGAPTEQRDQPWFRKAAEQGDAEAQCNMGMCYHSGTVVEQDLEQAVVWYRRAAGQGYAEAQYNLGRCYGTGEGVSEDRTQTVKWFRKAAEQGHILAQSCLAWRYLHGDGVSLDYKQAVKWFRKAAEQGEFEAQFHLGLCHQDGNGVPRDLKLAAEWYRKAAEQGHGEAQCNLAMCYASGEGVDQDSKQAAGWFCKAAEQGLPAAQAGLWMLSQSVSQ